MTKSWSQTMQTILSIGSTKWKNEEEISVRFKKLFFLKERRFYFLSKIHLLKFGLFGARYALNRASRAKICCWKAAAIMIFDYHLDLISSWLFFNQNKCNITKRYQKQKQTLDLDQAGMTSVILLSVSNCVYEIFGFTHVAYFPFLH